MEFEIGETKIFVTKGDVTEQICDGTVNAVNSSLMGGSGVDGAIHRKGGPAILEQCKRIREVDWPHGLPTGKAVITTGGNLKTRYVIHTLEPVWRGGSFGEAELLADAYRNSLELVTSKGLRSLAFPSISTGAYGYPIAKASKVALTTVREFLKKNDNLNVVIFVLFSQSALDTYMETLKEFFDI